MRPAPVYGAAQQLPFWGPMQKPPPQSAPVTAYVCELFKIACSTVCHQPSRDGFSGSFGPVAHTVFLHGRAPKIAVCGPTGRLDVDSAARQAPYRHRTGTVQAQRDIRTGRPRPWHAQGLQGLLSGRGRKGTKTKGLRRTVRRRFASPIGDFTVPDTGRLGTAGAPTHAL